MYICVLPKPLHPFTRPKCPRTCRQIKLQTAYKSLANPLKRFAVCCRVMVRTCWVSQSLSAGPLSAGRRTTSGVANRESIAFRHLSRTDWRVMRAREHAGLLGQEDQPVIPAKAQLFQNSRASIVLRVSRSIFRPACLLWTLLLLIILTLAMPVP